MNDDEYEYYDEEDYDDEMDIMNTNEDNYDYEYQK